MASSPGQATVLNIDAWTGQPQHLTRFFARAASAARLEGAHAAAIPAHRRGWARCRPSWQGKPA